MGKRAQGIKRKTMKTTELPANLLYDNQDSWVKSEGRRLNAEGRTQKLECQGQKKQEEVVIVGLIEPSVKKAREFVFINLPKQGSQVKKGDVYVSLEAVKWSGHVPSPVSGEVIEVNSLLFDSPSTINKDPYGKGWIMKVKIKKPEELNLLLDAKEKAKRILGA